MKKIILTSALMATCMLSSAQNTVMSELQKDANSLIYANAASNLNGEVYLGLPEWKVSAIIPTDNGIKKYIDPLSYTNGKYQMWEFAYDESQPLANRLSAKVYECKKEANGDFVKTSDSPLYNITKGFGNMGVKNRLQHLYRNTTIKGILLSGKKYYPTMGNNFVRIDKEGSGYMVYGAMNNNSGNGIPAEVKETDNGALIAVNEPILTSDQSVAKVLSQNDTFSEFFKILQASGAISHTDPQSNSCAVDQEYGNLIEIKEAGSVGAEAAKQRVVIPLLDDYHYTIYVPTNEAMQLAYQAGLPTLDMLEAARQEDEEAGIDENTSPDSKAAKIKDVMLDFVKYHIQDGAVFVDEGFESGLYCSAKYKVVPATGGSGKFTLGSPYKLNVQVNPSSIQVTDAMGNTRTVLTKSGIFNLMANEYWSSSSRVTENQWVNTIKKSSFAVIHAIDGPLLYNAPAQFTYEYMPISEP